MGTMHSIPISSAICASLRLFSQLASQRSGSVAYVLPLEQLAPKSPSLRPLPFTRTALRCRIRAFSSPPLHIPHAAGGRIALSHDVFDAGVSTVSDSSQRDSRRCVDLPCSTRLARLCSKLTNKRGAARTWPVSPFDRAAPSHIPPPR